jgi:cytochrome c
MDFIKDSALPPSLEHFRLLLFILNLVYVVLLPYLGFLLGTSILSLVYGRRGEREHNLLYLQFAKDAIDIGLNNKTVVTFLGLVPALSLVFIYAQLLQSTPAISVSLAGYAFIALLASAILLYSYRYTAGLARLLSSYQDLLQKSHDAAGGKDIAEFALRTEGTHRKSGRYGLLLLCVTVVLTVGALTVASRPDEWRSIDTAIALLVSVDFYAKLLQFLSLAAGGTGIGILFFQLEWEGGRGSLHPEYRAFVRKVCTTLGFVSLLLQPLLLVVNIMLLPPAALSGALMGISGVSILLFFLTVNLLYAALKEERPGYISYAFYVLGVALVLVFTADQMAIGNATRLHSARLAVVHEKATEALKAALGVGAPAARGEDIYNGRCSACHLFDQKKVGPAYKDVIPKYAGKKAQLIAFVLNPVKVNPAFPPMPNQGLRPAEADSIATFLLNKFTAPQAAQAPSGQQGEKR